MPVRFRIVLVPQAPLRAQELYPDRLHGLFFSLLGEKLSREVHEDYRLKPFSLSFYYQSGEHRRQLPCSHEEEVEKLFIEIAFLKDELFPRFLSSLMLEDRPLRLGDVPLRKVKRPIVRERDLLGYETLMDDNSESLRVTLIFVTPTTFKRGKADYPLPDPRLILKGLIKKWHTFSGIRIDRDLSDAMERGIKVAGAWLGTERVSFSDMGLLTGFKGRVILSLEDLPEEERKWILRLLRFAEFAGVGRKTTMGLGKVRLSYD